MIAQALQCRGRCSHLPSCAYFAFEPPASRHARPSSCASYSTCAEVGAYGVAVYAMHAGLPGTLGTEVDMALMHSSAGAPGWVQMAHHVQGIAAMEGLPSAPYAHSATSTSLTAATKLYEYTVHEEPMGHTAALNYCKALGQTLAAPRFAQDLTAIAQASGKSLSTWVAGSAWPWARQSGCFHLPNARRVRPGPHGLALTDCTRPDGVQAVACQKEVPRACEAAGDCWDGSWDGVSEGGKLTVSLDCAAKTFTLASERRSLGIMHYPPSWTTVYAAAGAVRWHTRGGETQRR